MRKYIFILSFAAAFAALAPAFAEIPLLRVEQTCRAAKPLFDVVESANGGTLGNPGPQNTYKNCMDSENAAQKSSAKLWPKVSGRNRTICAGLSRMVYPSYVELLSCLQMYDPTTFGNASTR